MLQLEATLARSVRAKPNFSALLERLAVSAWFAYTTILLLQLKVVWRIWSFKDLTPDDTAYYFTVAHGWYTNLRTVFPLSPLYTAFYGSFLHVTPDAYFATVAHRLVIIFVLAALVLYLMRRFLPPAIAWFMTAWWVVLPIDFDTKYEVHLFSVIPLLTAVLLAAWKSPWSRPSALAAFICTALLVRNEYFIATGLFACALLVYELRRSQRDGTRESRRTLLRYAVAVVPVVIITGILFLRAGEASTMARMATDKHRLNWCQVYTYGYEQRHQDYTTSPWSDCAGLMNRTFGTPQPSMFESVRRNPRAAVEHFTWNLSLIPNGLELLLFNVTGGSVTPDYHPVAANPALTYCLIAILIGIIVSGAIVIYREPTWWVEVFESETWAWTAITSIAVVTAFVMITQRPRPSYMLALGIFARLATGVAVWAISRGWNTRPFRRAVPALACILILVVPSAYKPGARNRPLLNAYRRLQPFQQTLRAHPVRLVSRGWGQELCNYVVAGVADCTPLVYSDVRSTFVTNASFAEMLESRQANALYVDDGIFAEQPVRQLLAGVPGNGWTQIGSGQVNGNHWALLMRDTAAHPFDGIVGPGSGLSLGAGWNMEEPGQATAFRSADNDAVINVEPGVTPLTVAFDLEPDPGAHAGRINLDVLDGSGGSLGHSQISTRQTIKINLPNTVAANQLRLHTSVDGHPAAAGTLNLRLFHVRAIAAPILSRPDPTDIVAATDGIGIGKGWYPFEAFGGRQFRWINNDAELILPAASGTATLDVDVEPGPGAEGKPLRIRFLDQNGATASAASISQFTTVRARLAVSATASSRYRIHIDGGGAATPTDSRILNLRVFRVGRSPAVQ